MKISSVLLQATLITSLLSACSLQPTQPHYSFNDDFSSIDNELNNDQEFLVDEESVDDVWQRIVNNYQFDLTDNNQRIDAHLAWFKSHPTYLERVADRGQRYLHFIIEEVEAREMPGEIALLPIVESAFNPFAYSHGLASGVWQFIPSTGRYYGLEQDWWQDGRRDIRAATVAALTYLQSLNKEFNGDWMLALAAYNSGGGTVRRAIRNNQQQGKPTDFWSLNLPKETREYVPKLIALAKVVQQPENYAMHLPPIANEPYFAVVETGGQIDLALVAELADTTIDEIYKLNPSYNYHSTAPYGPHEVLIPVDKVEIFHSSFAEIPAESRIQWQRYTVKSGDTLIKIAKQFNTTTEVVKQTNNLQSNLIRPGDGLLIPSALYNENHYSLSANKRLERTIEQRRPNNSASTKYKVRQGDSLWSIAKQHKVKVNDLARWNGLAPKDTLATGKELTIWQSKAQPVASNLSNPFLKQRNMTQNINYTVRKGDSFAAISQRYNVSINDIKSWNEKESNQKYLQPGQKLRLIVDIRQ